MKSHNPSNPLNAETAGIEQSEDTSAQEQKLDDGDLPQHKVNPPKTITLEV